MPFTRDDIRDSVERAGDQHWDALRHHHEDAYPNPKPTPGDVCKGSALATNTGTRSGTTTRTPIPTRSRRPATSANQKLND